MAFLARGIHLGAVGAIFSFVFPIGWLQVIPSMVVLAAYVLVWRRCFRVALSADSHGVKVVNFWHSYDLEWTEIVEIRPRIYFISVAVQNTLGFVLRSGKVVPAEATVWPGKYGGELLNRLGDLARPYGIPVNVAPPKKTRIWGAEFRKLPEEQRRPYTPRPGRGSC